MLNFVPFIFPRDFQVATAAEPVSHAECLGNPRGHPLRQPIKTPGGGGKQKNIVSHRVTVKMDTENERALEILNLCLAFKD